jgi:hypothetical protein
MHRCFRHGARRVPRCQTPSSPSPVRAQEASVTVPFWIMIVLFVIVGFMLFNTYYWKNVRDEHAYRVRKWKARAQDVDVH